MDVHSITTKTRKQKALILIFSTIVYVTILLAATIHLFDKSYALKESDIYKIDSVKLLSRAYYLNSSKSSSKSGLEFQDSTLKTFRLEKLDLSNGDDLKILFDTLQFSRTVLTIYTDKDGLNNYQNGRGDQVIPVLNISIGGRQFGHLNALHANASRKLYLLLIGATLIYGLFLVYITRAAI